MNPTHTSPSRDPRPHDTPWLRLVEAARRASLPPPDTSLPPGLATRVVALAFADNRRLASGGLLPWLDRLAWRAFGLASLAMTACILWSVVPSAATAGGSHDPASVSDYLDPVGEVLAVAQSS